MTLAQLSTRYPPGPGGVERHVAEVAQRLGARGRSVNVYTTELYTEYPWRRLPPEVPRFERTAFGCVRRLPAWSLPGELHYPFFRGLAAQLARDRPELLHVHTFGTHQAAVARRHHRKFGVPYVLTAHFHPIWSIEGGWLRHRIRGFYDRRLAGPILGEAARVIVQSREEERLLRALGTVLPPVTIVPPGRSALPDPRAGEPSFAARFGVPGPFILFVGRLASNKGLLVLLEAFAPLARSDPTAHLVLVGEDGGMGTAIDVRARTLGILDRVHRVGFVADDSTLAGAFRDARVSVLPSQYEAFGLVLLEALAQGTPVVATRVGGVPELIEDGRAGLLVPPDDAAALSGALTRLWNDPALARQLGEYGRSHVVPNYTWDAAVDRLEAVYREVLGR